MNNDLKVYEEIVYIYLKDGTILHTTLKIDALAELFNENDFVVVDGVGFNRYEVKTFKVNKIDGIEGFILLQTKEVQKKLISREKQKKQRVGRGFDTIEEIQSYLSDKNIV